MPLVCPVDFMPYDDDMNRFLLGVGVVFNLLSMVACSSAQACHLPALPKADTAELLSTTSGLRASACKIEGSTNR